MAIKSKKKFEPLIFWISLIGHVFTMFIIDGTLRTYGLLYLEFLDIFAEGPQITGLVATIHAIFIACSGPFLGMIIDYFGPWIVLLLEGIIGCVGLIMSAYAPNLYVIYVGYGVFLAISITGGFVASTAAVAGSFLYNRTLALGIAFAGGSVGTMVYPLLFQAIVPELTAKGFLMINAGLYLNMAVVGLLVYATSKTKVPQNLDETTISKKEVKRDEAETTLEKEIKILEDARNTTREETEKQNGKTGCWQKVLPFFTLKALSLFLWYFTYIFTVFGYLMYFPPFAKDLGLTELQRVALLSIYGATDLVSRIGVGILGGFRRVSIYVLISVNMTIVGIVTILLPSLLNLASVYNVLLGHMLIFGLFAGGVYGLLGSIAFDAVGGELAGTAIGISGGFFGLAFALPPIIYGSLKQSTDSYMMVPYLSGAAALLCAVVVQIGQIRGYYSKMCCRFKKTINVTQN